jgi:hypothetical protein
VASKRHDSSSCSRQVWSWVCYILELFKYFTLYLGTWLYSGCPALLVVAKHALDIKSKKYVVANKRSL